MLFRSINWSSPQVEQRSGVAQLKLAFKNSVMKPARQNCQVLTLNTFAYPFDTIPLNTCNPTCSGSQSSSSSCEHEFALSGRAFSPNCQANLTPARRQLQMKEMVGRDRVSAFFSHQNTCGWIHFIDMLMTVGAGAGAPDGVPEPRPTSKQGRSARSALMDPGTE